MKNTMRYCTVWILLCLICSCRYGPNPLPTTASRDGRFGSRCQAPIGTAHIDICLVSVDQLLILPERFDKKHIIVQGLITNEDGRLLLYPNIAAANVRNTTQAIVIKVPIGSDFFGLNKGYVPGYFRFRGIFHGFKPGLNSIYSGEIVVSATDEIELWENEIGVLVFGDRFHARVFRYGGYSDELYSPSPNKNVDSQR